MGPSDLDERTNYKSNITHYGDTKPHTPGPSWTPPLPPVTLLQDVAVVLSSSPSSIGSLIDVQLSSSVVPVHCRKRFLNFLSPFSYSEARDYNVDNLQHSDVVPPVTYGYLL